jgi:hypothetical protein
VTSPWTGTTLFSVSGFSFRRRLNNYSRITRNLQSDSLRDNADPSNGPNLRRTLNCTLGSGVRTPLVSWISLSSCVKRRNESHTARCNKGTGSPYTM